MGHELEIANFTCKFGDNLELLDVFENWFLPTLKTSVVSGSKSKQAETLAYRFINLKIEIIDNTPVLCGNFVKSLNIRANQRLNEDEELIESEDSMLSDPSSFFALILTNHKLLWIREVPRAPLLKDLRYAVEKMLKDFRLKELKRILENKIKDIDFEAVKTEKEKTELLTNAEKEAYREIPQPTLDITPLGDKTILGQALSDFKVVKTIQIRALKKNNEFAGDLNSFISDYSETSDILGSTDTELIYKNNEGLNKEKAESFLKSALDGNFKFIVNGVGENNQKLRKSEDKISLKVPIKYDKTALIEAKIRTMLEKYQTGLTLFNNPKEVAEDIKQKALEVANRLR